MSERSVSKKFVVLLGAGASVEAGLSTSAQLTERIYQDISASRMTSEYARALGYVISRLQVRNTKMGLSPYHPIEIEELFDALNLLYRRDSLLISEFVERWDSSVEKHYQKFDHRAIESSLNNVV